MFFDDPDGDYLDPIDRDPSDYDDARNDWDGEDGPEPGDTESDMEDDDLPDEVWNERWGIAEAESFMEMGVAIW